MPTIISGFGRRHRNALLQSHFGAGSPAQGQHCPVSAVELTAAGWVVPRKGSLHQIWDCHFLEVAMRFLNHPRWRSPEFNEPFAPIRELIVGERTERKRACGCYSFCDDVLDELPVGWKHPRDYLCNFKSTGCSPNGR